MPQWQKVVLPATSGVAQQFDPIGAPAEVPIDIINGRFDKRGTIVKRFGFNSKTGGSPVGTIKRLWSTGEELYASNFDGVWSLVTETSSAVTFQRRGARSPFGGETVELWKDSRSWDQCDAFSAHDGPVVFAAGNVKFPGKANPTVAFGWSLDRAVYGAIYATDGTCLCERQEFATGARLLVVADDETKVGSDTCPHSVRALALNDNYSVSFIKNDKLLTDAFNDHGSILIYAATSSLGPFSHVLTVADVYHDDYNIRTYDTRPYHRTADLDSTFYHLAYIRWADQTVPADRGVRISNLSSAHVVQYSLDINRAGYQAVRVAIGSHSGSGTVVLAVLWVDTATGNNFNLSLYRLSDGGSSITVHTTHNAVATGLTASELFDNFGWAEVYDTVGVVTRWVLTYGHFTTEAVPIAHTGIRTECITMPADCASYTGPTKLSYNCIPQTQPFFVDGDRAPSAHVFMSLGSFNFDYSGRWFQKEYLFETRGIFELAANSAEWASPTAEFRGRHASGVDCGIWRSLANTKDNLFQGNAPWTLRCGSANSVTKPAASTVAWLERNTYHYGNCQRAETIDQSAVMLYAQKHRMSACHTTLCQAARMTEASCTRGGHMIGGAVPVWCDGATCHEQSFSLPPFIVSAVRDAGHGSAAGGTVRWNAHWATADDRGITHRGLPAADYQLLVLLNDADYVYTRSNALTMRREPIPLVTVQLYRSDANGIMRRALHPTAQIPNYQFYSPSYDGYLNQVAWDDHTDTTGTPLYTEGQVYESAALEGCDIVHVALERVWMAGAFHRDAVYYSKRFAALDGVVAPEFHEAFSFVVPDGQRVTGLGSVGDRVIVMTEGRVYAVAGQGPADDGSANDFSQLVCISPTVGCADPRSVVCTDEGVYFYSGESIYVVTAGLQVVDIGAPMEDTIANYDTVSGAVWWPEESSLVFVVSHNDRSGSQLIVYDTRWKSWCHWTVKNYTGATTALESVCVHKGNLYAADATGYLYVAGPSTGYADGHYTSTKQYVTLDVSTGWIQAGGLAGWQLVRLVTVFANFVASHTLNISVYRDFAATTTDTGTVTVTSGVNETIHRKPAVHKCQAARVRVWDTDVSSPAYGAGFKLAAIGAEVAPIGQSAKVAAAKR